jgi:hypothetical protein
MVSEWKNGDLWNTFITTEFGKFCSHSHRSQFYNHYKNCTTITAKELAHVMKTL